MTTYGRNTLSAVAAISLTLLGGVAASASAGTGSTAGADAPLTPPNAAAATAKCPSGTKATGGGFRIADGYQPPPASTGTRSITQVAAPSGKRAWHVVSEGFGAVKATTLTAIARCSPGIKSVSLATASTTLDPGVAKALQPRCPPTRRAVGGGFKVSPTFHFTPLPIGGPLIVPLESRRIDGRDWRVTAANVNTGAYVTPGDLTAYAVCASGSAKVRTVTSSAPIANNQRTTAVAICPSKWHTISGGFKASPIFDDPTKSLYILPELDASAPEGSKAWSAAATISSPFNTPATSGTIAAYAYCEHN